MQGDYSDFLGPSKGRIDCSVERVQLVQSGGFQAPIFHLMQWFLTRTRYWIGFLLLLMACFFALQKLAGYSLVRVQLESSYTTAFKVYWQTEADGGWFERNSVFVRVNPRTDRYVLLLPVPLPAIQKLRIDPSDHKDVISHLSSISLHHLYVKTITFGGLNNSKFSRFEPTEHSEILAVGHTLKLNSLGDDAGFYVDLPAMEIQPEPFLRLAQSFLLALVLFSVIVRFPWLAKNLRWVPQGLFLVACAAMVMATVSNINTHPDERTHLNNALYYADHYIPPEVCSDETLFTYSTYGVSRLDKREIAYYVGGRYLQLVDFIPAPSYLKLRFFNVALLFVLVMLAFRHLNARYLFLPLLLTPQAWYLFSYYNSDALSLFAVVITAYQVFVPQSILRRLLNGERPPGYMLWVLGLSVLVAMQYWLKLNYMFYPILLLMIAVSWWLLNRRWPNFQNVAPMALAIVLGTSLFLTWEVSRHTVNDFSLAEKVRECAEQTADIAYKPSTPLFQTHPTILLRAKGVSLRDFFVKHDWAERIFYTGLGTYGYTEYLNTYTHYEIVSAFILLFFLYVITMVAIKGDGLARMSVLSTIAAIVGITIAAIINNWFQSFQPQGRYLMVYLPLLGTLIVMYANKLSVIWLSILASIPFLFGLYSFFAVALIEIPK